MVIKARGKLNFFLENRTRKHESQSAWKVHAIIETACDLERYYAWFLETRFNLKLNKTLRGTHISFIADRYDTSKWKEVADVFHDKEIDFYYEIEPRSNGEHWWLRVHCPEAESIREAIGLPKDPFFGMHMTLGFANEKNIDHSNYILRQCINFGLTSSDSKKPLGDHDVYEFMK